MEKFRVSRNKSWFFSSFFLSVLISLMRMCERCRDVKRMICLFILHSYLLSTWTLAYRITIKYVRFIWVSVRVRVCVYVRLCVCGFISVLNISRLLLLYTSLPPILGEKSACFAEMTNFFVVWLSLFRTDNNMLFVKFLYNCLSFTVKTEPPNLISFHCVHQPCAHTYAHAHAEMCARIVYKIFSHSHTRMFI